MSVKSPWAGHSKFYPPDLWEGCDRLVVAAVLLVGGCHRGASTARPTGVASASISPSPPPPDDATDKRVPDAGRPDCERIAAGVVNHLPEVKAILAAANKVATETDGRARYGGLGPMDDGSGGYTVGLGIQTDEHFEAQVWYSVDVAGHLAVSVLGSDVAVPGDGLRAVERACKP